MCASVSIKSSRMLVDPLAKFAGELFVGGGQREFGAR